MTAAISELKLCPDNLVTDRSLAQDWQTIAKYLFDRLPKLSFGTRRQRAGDPGNEALLTRVTFKNALLALFAAAFD